MYLIHVYLNSGIAVMRNEVHYDRKVVKKPKVLVNATYFKRD